MIGHVSHCPRQLNRELLRTSHPVVFDCETTGLDVLSDRVLSYGFRIRSEDKVTNFIIFTEQCRTLSIHPHISKNGDVREALTALSQPRLVLVGHNIKFDLMMLRRERIPFTGVPRDTQAILRMLDQDRGFSADKTAGRRDLTSPFRRSNWLNYRLKDVASQLLKIKPFYTPNCLAGVGYKEHTTYLTYDLYATDCLYQKIWRQLSVDQVEFYGRFSSPLTQLLCDLKEIGLQADEDFMGDETIRLKNQLDLVSKLHFKLFRIKLLTLSDDELRKLLYKTYGLPEPRRKKGSKPPIDSTTIHSMVGKASSDQLKQSLQLIEGYRALQSQMQRLEGYRAYVHLDGRIHSSFDETRQTSGRISSTNPNLQQISRSKFILKGTSLETSVKARNLLTATPGFILVGADIDQADIRMLAERIDNCRVATNTHVASLHQDRNIRLAQNLVAYEKIRHECRNVDFDVASPEPPPNFDPSITSQLVYDFQNLTDDLYSRIATKIMGRTITKIDPDRAIFKTVTLAQINGQSVGSLAKELKCDRDTAKEYVEKLTHTYPDVAGFLALLRQELAITGQLANWAGRIRTHSAHRWMVNDHRVHILLTYRDGHRYWFDVSPLQPSLRNLTCYVHKIWSVRDPRGAKNERLIFTDARGRIGTRTYPQIDKPSLYQLPVRNLPWSNIRRVRKLDASGSPTEEAKYEGFDATARSIINSVMQGGTSDLTTFMALCSQDLIKKNRGRLLLMVHDELIWEVPQENQLGANGIPRILFELQELLERPPSPNFNVPITVGMKYGNKFGEMAEI